VLKEQIPSLLRGRRVLEIAAGTGYWTQYIAPAAASVLATDLNSAPLGVAEGRGYGSAKVAFQLADAFALGNIQGDFDAVFVGFLWSHLPARQIPAFLDGIARRLPSGTQVVAVDNRYVHGSNVPIARTDAEGNTYQLRSLQDGSTWEVLKNFPSPEALQHSVQPYSDDVAVDLLTYYWLLRYTLR
jgi:ubiquinone/menaquinone biosynthesis C-methylase UbiE